MKSHASASTRKLPPCGQWLLTVRVPPSPWANAGSVGVDEAFGGDVRLADDAAAGGGGHGVVEGVDPVSAVVALAVEDAGITFPVQRHIPDAADFAEPAPAGTDEPPCRCSRFMAVPMSGATRSGPAGGG